MRHEVSPNAGGLLRWPVKLLIPVGFCLLALQGISEIIKRIGFLMGLTPDPAEKSRARRQSRARDGSPAVSQFLIDNMAPLMFAALVVFLLIGYPVAFSLAAVGLSSAFIGIELGLFNLDLLQALPERVFGIMSNDTLLAIPFFTFMGLILERSGMAEDLLDTIGQLFGPVRGGLAYAVIFVGALLAATTGMVAASVISMGLISLPIMLRYGYDRRLAAGVIAASGTLAQIIPPSLVLIVMADQLGRSVGDMYAGAFIPGLVACRALRRLRLHRPIVRPAAVRRCRRKPSHTRGERQGRLCLARRSSLPLPSRPRSSLPATCMPIWACASAGPRGLSSSRSPTSTFKLGVLSRLAQQVVIVMMPPLALIFLVLGTIFLGIATPTEGGAMGATGAHRAGARQSPAELDAAPPGDGHDRQALVLRDLHPGRLDRLQPGLPRRQRRPLGREHC